jgi:hypothetical protein
MDYHVASPSNCPARQCPVNRDEFSTPGLRGKERFSLRRRARGLGCVQTHYSLPASGASQLQSVAARQGSDGFTFN